MIEITLTQDYKAIVSVEDADLASFRWHVAITNNHPYAHRSYFENGKRVNVRMHRLIMERSLGRTLLSSEWVDHADGDSLNNQRYNLRLATIAENNRNAKLRADNRSGYKGVDFHNGKWRARITVNGKTIFLGYSSSAEDAFEVYKVAAEKYHGAFARCESVVIRGSVVNGAEVSRD